ncbi:hypothetical protein BC833DRAFT_601076 [Globomyces pollinis-pini]|nr:hypothetical protein BC833DRAFT_601076 [Globomyces pollinis-pini]
MLFQSLLRVIFTIVQLSAIHCLQAPCESITTRVEWRELTDDQKNNYLNAIICLKQTASVLKVGSPSLYNDFVYVHAFGARRMHNTAQFLPWHRAYLGIFEKKLREQCEYIDPLPYWDWNVDSQYPEISPVWDWIGGNGNFTTGCIVGGSRSNIFQDFQADFPKPHCVTRRWSASGKNKTGSLGSLYSAVILERYLSIDNYNGFRIALESIPHNLFHQAIGGDMANPITAVNDPVFFLHHSNIDRLWWKWQKRNPMVANTYSGSLVSGGIDNGANLNNSMRFYGLDDDYLVKDVLDTTENSLLYLCYDYSNSVTSTVEPSVVSSNSFEQITMKLQTRVSQKLIDFDEVETTKVNGPATSPDEIDILDMNNLDGSPLPESVLNLYNVETPEETDRQDLINIRYPSSLQASHLRLWGYSSHQIQVILQSQNDTRKFVEFINSLPLQLPSSLGHIVASEISGWRSKSDLEVFGDDNLQSALNNAMTQVSGRFNLTI